MRAVVWTKYGSPDGLEFRDIPKPMPKDNEVLIKVHAATVTAGDSEMRGLRFPLWLAIPIRLYMGLTKPRDIVLGQEMAGEVEAVGKDVTRFKPGDQVFGTTGMRLGGHADYIRLPEKTPDSVLATKPSNMSYAEAATVPTGGLEALHYLRKADIKPGEKVLIIGGGGSIGTFAIQLAKYYGAEVTAIDSTAKLDMMRSIGADHVIDYTREDFTQNGQTYDVIFDVMGKGSYSGSLKALNPNGRLAYGNPKFSYMIRQLFDSGGDGKRVIIGTPSQRDEGLLYLKQLIEDGKLKTVIDRRFPLEQAADAHRFVDSGQKQGHVVITVVPED
ncbi:MAG: NAD(P)-dependent alcohol dehydrogenase [Anaerolineae bacterium]|nr:NAD(P)-dependent alcohol dehydrogenase [Anaerolineae bacterium]